MPANAGQSAVDGQGSSLQNRFRADAGRTINTKSSPCPSSRQAQLPVNLDPSAGKSPSPPPSQTQQAGRITRSIWWNAGTREGPSGVAVNTGFFAAVSLLRGNQPPPHSGGPLAPTRRAHRFLHAKLCPDPTPRGHDHGWPSVGNATTSMRCPSAGKPSSSSTSHCAIRIQIQISTNCPNIACHANLAAAANQRALYHSHSGAQQMPSSPPLLAV